MVFQLECMSSEESIDDEDETGTVWSSVPDTMSPVIVRGPAWRSVRLVRLMSILDRSHEALREQDRERNGKKREAPLRTRRDGPLKEEALPPEGIPAWMISKRWLTTAQAARLMSQGTPMEPNSQDSITDVNWSLLGSESDAETNPEA
jgi:hypothetical protein